MNWRKNLNHIPADDQTNRIIDVYAQSIEGKPVDEWHRLEAHLKGTAELAASFAAEFGYGEWGYLAGLWHEVYSA